MKPMHRNQALRIGDAQSRHVTTHAVREPQPQGRPQTTMQSII